MHTLLRRIKLISSVVFVSLFAFLSFANFSKIIAATDSDNDGIPDTYDYCPTEPYVGSTPGATGGCPNAKIFNDPDGDLWSSDIDDCPITPGPDSIAGCPLVTANDSDGDGVLNANDNCPSQPGGIFYGGCYVNLTLDQDHDTWIDFFDHCPAAYGVNAFGGCADPTDTSVAPVANFTVSPTSGYEPIFAVATDTSTNNPLSWQWTYTHLGTGFSSEATTKNLEFLVSAAKTGNWQITLTVTNTAGTNSITKIINFNSYVYPDEDPHNGTLPVANFVANVTSGPAPLAVTFTNLSQYGTSYAWDTNNDGVFNSTPYRDNWIYFSTPGTYTISLRVTNSAGTDTETKVSYIRVTDGTTPLKPIASFTADKISGPAPLTVQFTDTSIDATSWSWDFQSDNVAESNVKNPSFTYTTPGIYSVRLYASNSSGTDTLVKTAFITVSDGPVTPTSPVVIYRFFNKKNGAHLYTISSIERDTVMTLTNEWSYEGEKFTVLTGPATDAVPVYRFWNKTNGAHLYTIDENEKNTIMNTLSQFVYEGIKFYVYPSQVTNSKPVYRFFNKKNGAHLYTDSETEKNTVMTLPNFQYEGVKFYVL